MAEGGHRPGISLDGLWDFVHASDGLRRSAQVPMPWQAQFADLRHVSGTATYAREVEVPPGPAGHQLWLMVGAAGYLAVVRVGGQEIARHEGGWLPFEVEVPPALIGRRLRIEITCTLPDGDPESLPGISFAEIPHGKQSWYGPTGGLWQSLRLEWRAPLHLRHCAITAEMTGEVRLHLETSAPGTPRIEILGPDGTVVATGATPRVAAPRLWSPDHPALYTARITLGTDITLHRFGFRRLIAREGKLFLNDQPFYLRAALDQDYYPEGICTPPSLAFLEDQLHKAKALGLNMLRCHIKVPDPRYYEVADRLGMLIWTEIPNVATLTPASKARMRATMEGILRRDGNHPSIVIWTLINEDWGTRTFDDPAHRAWLIGEYDWLKAADPTRLVVDNSPCHNNFHLKSDLNDFHYYRSVPERRAEWDALTAEFAAGADWTWSPFGDGQRRGDEPLIVSEFGVWGLPRPSQLRLGGAEPWWMETGATWGDGAALPHGIETRFATLGLQTVFGGFEAFITAVQWYQFENLAYEIEVMRAHPAIQGYVITEFTDVHWESNGLLDMNRNPRVFHDRFATINADVVIAPGADRRAGVAGEAHAFQPVVATGGAQLSGAVLHWTCGDQAGEVALPETGPQDAARPGTVTVTLPEGAGPAMTEITLEVRQGGVSRATNRLKIATFPRRDPAARRLRVAAANPALASRAEALGHPVVPAGQAEVILAHALDEGDIRALQAGARYLVLADGTEKTSGNLRREAPRREQPFLKVVDDIPGLPQGAEAPLPNIGLVARHGTMWRGDWIAGFSWFRRTGAFAALPGGPLLDLAYDRVVPHHVMTGFRAHEFSGAVIAGLVVGWVHKPAALIAERQVGQGALLASTFRLCTEEPGADPVATALWDALVATAGALRVHG